MSADAPYLRRGVLEFSKSLDNGKTWSPWKIIASSKHGAPDKPWMAIKNNGDIHVVYVDYRYKIINEKERLYGRAIRIISKDGGSTWTFPQEIRSSNPTIVDRGEHVTSVGVSVNKRVSLALSTRRKKSNVLYFYQEDKTGNFQEQELLEIPKTSIVNLISSATSEHLALVWYGSHEMSPIYFMQSFDEGKTWRSPIKLSKNGNLAAGSIDHQGRFHLVWNDSDSGGYIQTKYRILNRHIEIFNEVIVQPYPKTGEYAGYNDDYSQGFIGAYQALIEAPRNVYNIFIIDWKESDKNLKYYKVNLILK